MTQRILLLDIRDDPALIERYEAHHAAGAVPAAITRSIREAGILDMRIFRSGNRLVMVMDVTKDFDPAAKAAADRSNPDVCAWEALMGELQQPLPWAPAGEKWIEARQIFALDQQSQ